jgi:hypothetical protein
MHTATSLGRFHMLREVYICTYSRYKVVEGLVMSTILQHSKRTCTLLWMDIQLTKVMYSQLASGKHSRSIKLCTTLYNFHKDILY